MNEDLLDEEEYKTEIKTFLMKKRWTCGANIDKYIAAPNHCHGNSTCKEPPTVIAALIYPIFNEIEKIRVICRKHSQMYKQKGQDNCQEALNYHWHTMEMKPPIPMLFHEE